MKKVLFVTYDFPYPTNTGGKNRAFNMLKHSGNTAKKYLFSFVREDFKEDYKEQMAKIGVEAVGTKQRRKLLDPRNILGLIGQESIFKTLYFSKSTLAELLSIIHEKKIDIVHFESYYTAFFISDEIKNMGAKQIFGTENIEFKTYQNYTKNNVFLPLKPIYVFQVNKIKKEETDTFRKADLCIAVSESDAGEIRNYNSKCEIVPNGVDLEEFRFDLPKNDKGNRLLFVGNFTYFPNVDAINYFYNSVFKALGDGIKLTIIGKKAQYLGFASDSRIICKEYVEKITDEYDNADLLISPVRLGGGTNFKVLEAMAKGVPVVSLPHRLEGLDVEDGKNIIVVNNDQDFIDKINELLDNFELRKKIARSARELIEKKYSWEAIGRKLSRVWESI